MQEQDENCVERHTLRIEEPLGERIGAKCRNIKDYSEILLHAKTACRHKNTGRHLRNLKNLCTVSEI